MKKEEIKLAFSKNQQVFKLGLVEDLQKTISTYKKSIDDLNSQITLMKKAKSEIEKAEKYADSIASKSDNIRKSAISSQTTGAKYLENVDKSAKDLGINPSGVKGYSEANKLYNTLGSLIKEVSSFKW
jgi:hypothetical protein